MTTPHTNSRNGTSAAATTSCTCGHDDGTTRADIWFLLDRSGSMESIADDVIGGFNAFFAEQKCQPGEATVSIVQFDSQDPQEFLVNRRPLTDVAPLRPGDFQPRGGTPLLDALGALLDHAEAVAEHDEDQLIVVLTDGQENASHRWSRDDLFGRIAKLTARGWTFVFLGANQDAYDEAGALGMSAGNTSNFTPSSAGVARTFAGTSRAVSDWRAKPRAVRLAQREEFWGDRKEAEEE